MRAPWPRVAPLLAAIVATAPLAAQRLHTGDWPVLLVMSDVDSVRLTLTATRERDRLRLDVAAPSGLAWGLGDVREDSARIRFTWALDRPTPMACTLAYRRPDYWEGYCDDRTRGADGKFLRLFLVVGHPDATAGTSQSRLHDSRFPQ